MCSQLCIFENNVPDNQSRAVENGANFLAEGFLFTVAVSVIVGETWRSSRSQSKRRDTVDDQLQELSSQVNELKDKTDVLEKKWNGETEGLKERCLSFFLDCAFDLTMNRNEELTRVLERIIWIGLKGGWTDIHSEKWQAEVASISQDAARLEGPKPSGSSDSDTSSR